MLEVVVEGALGHLGFFGDLGDGDIGVILFQEQGLGSGEDIGDGAFGLGVCEGFHKKYLRVGMF